MAQPCTLQGFLFYTCFQAQLLVYFPSNTIKSRLAQVISCLIGLEHLYCTHCHDAIKPSHTVHHPTWLWIAFAVFIIICLLIGLIILHRDDHKISVKEALRQTGGWVVLSLAAGVGFYFYLGSSQALDYFTGYLIEYSLSIDNIFVFLLIFNYFKVDPRYQYKVLFWGIFGAL